MTTRMSIRRIGISSCPWVTACPRCDGRKRAHLVPGIGVVSVNDMVGNRSWRSALHAVRAHLDWHDARCGACRLGLLTHQPQDPQCTYHDRRGA